MKMPKKKKNAKSQSGRARTVLRKRAEARADPGAGAADSRLVHELQVHMIELEIQNEELQRARAEAEEALARYTELYEFAPVGYLTLDRSGTIVKMNLTCERLLGCERARLLGTPLRMAVTEGSRQACDAFLSRLAGEGAASCEVVVSTATLELSGQAAPGSEEYRVVANDVTERKRLEETHIAEDRLTALGALAGGIAHEINNPLTWVLDDVDALVADLPRAESQPGLIPVLRERAEEASSGLRRIRDLSRALRTFTIGETAERGAVDPLEAVEAAISLAANEIRFRAQLVRELEPLPAVRATKAELTQVVLDLLLTAAYAIAEGSAEKHRVTVRTRAESGCALVEIEDTGLGISPEELLHVFEPYAPGGAPRNAGLRLAVCRNIVTQLGGEIRASSRSGAGTLFRVQFPPAPIQATPPVAAARPAAVRRVRILIVDDEPAIRSILVRMLRREYELVVAASGVAALALLETDAAFDAVLCDLMMPDLTGMELHRRIREENATLAARFVFITGGAFTPRASEYLGTCGVPTVEKPFEPAELRSLIAKVVA